MDVFDYTIRSPAPDRLSHYPEWVFVDEWRKQNERVGCVNSGFRLLELLLATESWQSHLPKRTNWIPQIVSQRDADVATAVIQWLGTACGRGFVFQCESRINRSRRHDTTVWNEAVNTPRPDEPDDIAIRAEAIAAQVDPESKWRTHTNLTLKKEIEATIRAFVAEAKGEPTAV